MPLYIIRQDITKLECDAIVNAANNTLLGGGGVDGAIHKAAGAELLEECKRLGGCDTGEAKITKAYNLPCKHVIHTVGPIWQGGEKGEKALLESCYKKSLSLAKENGCESVAFPLISAGVYGYPKDKALAVAAESISEFLFKNEMTVYIVVFDKASYQISEELFDDVQEYIDDNYVDDNYVDDNYADENYVDDNYADENGYYLERSGEVCCRRVPIFKESDYDLFGCFEEKIEEPTEDLSLLDMLSKIDDNFAVTLLKLIDIKGMSDVECYKKANVSKQTWYKIMNEKEYKPSKNTVISFAIALELSLEEAKRLLSTVGFTLSKSSKFDIIIEYFLLKEEYNIFIINETLFKFDQVCLGV
ncbi:MAG: O-acetyl-ADP-ribose deacetylase [Clostridia bacterium]|nr:O-acetyl-ADP-ribose deacetylase [Clostridia bacterium]